MINKKLELLSERARNPKKEIKILTTADENETAEMSKMMKKMFTQ